MKILESIGQFIAEKVMLVYNVIKNHKKDKNNPHEVTKAQVGLGNVDNTSDADKPMSKVVTEAIGNISGDLNSLERSFDTEISNIKNGITIVGKSEYAQKLGTEQDNFTKSSIEQALNVLLSDASLDPETFILTFTYRNGTQKTFDLPIEMTVKDGRYDEETKELVLVLVSEQEIRIPASGLTKVYIGKESTTTTVSIDDRTGEISVDVKQGSITKEHLTTELQTEIQKLTNLPENGNETFATKEEINAIHHYVNNLIIDVTDLDDYMNLFDEDEEGLNAGIISSLNEQLSNADLDVPFFKVGIRDGRNTYYCTGRYIRRVANSVSILLDLSTELEYLFSYNRIGISVGYTSKTVNYISGSRIENREIKFISENTDGIISADEAGLLDLLDSIKKQILFGGEGVAFYLKSTRSGNDVSVGYIPAVYDFKKDTATGKIPGFIQISYPKLVNGKNELWIERWSFVDIDNTQYSYKIDKIPLDGLVNLVTEYPTDLTSYPEGSIFIKTA